MEILNGRKIKIFLFEKNNLLNNKYNIENSDCTIETILNIKLSNNKNKSSVNIYFSDDSIVSGEFICTLEQWNEFKLNLFTFLSNEIQSNKVSGTNFIKIEFSAFIDQKPVFTIINE